MPETTKEQTTARVPDGRSGTPDAGSQEHGRTITRFDVHRAGQLSASKLRAVSTLNEAFARRMTDALGTLLRTAFEMRFVSAEQVAYGEWFSKMPELTYLAFLRTPGLGGHAIIQTDLSLVFPIVDLLLGGLGKSQAEVRKLTEIEEQLFEPVMRMASRELRATWSAVLELEFTFDQRQEIQPPNLLPPAEKVLVLRFEISLPEAQGTLHLVLSTVVASALLRKLSVDLSPAEPVNSQKAQARLQERLLESRFDLELMLPPGSVSVRDFMKLQPGSVLVLQPRATDPIHLNVGGKNMFFVSPVRCGVQRGAQIRRVISIAGQQGKETQ